MHLGDPDTKRQRLIVIGIAAFFFLVTFIAYNGELGDVLILAWARLKTLINQPLNLPQHVYDSEAKIGYNLFWGILVTGLVWVVLISQQATLPVRPFYFPEVFRAGWHLILWIIQQHGPAIFVRDGKSNSDEKDTEREGPGVIVVDYNSAVVLETQISAMGLSRRYSRSLQAFSRLLGLSEKPESPRARGAGIIFTLPRERIRGVVDLRKQFRMQREVRCYTRDGIEISANVHCTFTLGQDPDVLLVTYDGEPRLANLRVIAFETIPDGYLRVRSISDNELDDADATEINQFYRVVSRSAEWFNYPGRPTPPVRPRRRGERLRPIYNPDRVFAAVSAQARSSSSHDTPIIWSELPARVACDFYREIFTQVNFDDMYNFSLNNRTTPFQLQAFRRRLTVRMRSCGMLSYQFVFQQERARFEIGHVYHQSSLRVSAVHALRNPKVLRERGIKVIHSSFGDPSPVSEIVKNQRLEAWRATWDRDLKVRMAEGDLRSMRLRSQAHAQALRDLSLALTTIIEERPFSDEAAALRILQALEAAAADAKTRQLLPGGTMDMLRYIETLLQPRLQEENNVGRLPNDPY